ncbi:MAG: sigma-70 family RNA polymerase sigma factor [Planctomycetes bacterium]|nr:sigma-70 family RNA polymerase sigma factor [Planctomycetota bacterium]
MGDQWLTRQTLVQRAQDPNDHQAWDEFVRYYHSFITVVLRKMQFYTGEMDDIVQEILIILWKALPSFEIDRDRCQFRTWMSVLIRNKAIDCFKSSKRYENHLKKAAEQMEALSEEQQSEIDQMIEQEWERHITHCALDNIRSIFSGSAIKVFELSLEGLSATEIASQTGVQEKSVKVLKSRVKKRVIKEIQYLRSELEM